MTFGEVSKPRQLPSSCQDCGLSLVPDHRFTVLFRCCCDCYSPVLLRMMARVSCRPERFLFRPRSIGDGAGGSSDLPRFAISRTRICPFKLCKEEALLLRLWRDGGHVDSRLTRRSGGGCECLGIQKLSRKVFSLDQIQIRLRYCSLPFDLPLKGSPVTGKDGDRIDFLCDLMLELLSRSCCIRTGFPRLSRWNRAGGVFSSEIWFLQCCSWRWPQISVLLQLRWHFWVSAEPLIKDQDVMT